MSKPALPSNNRSALLTGPIWPTLLRLAAPNMLGVLVISTISIVEASYVGGLGRNALAGVALVMPVVMLQGMLSAGAIGGAVAGATARAAGADDLAGAEAALRIAILISFGGALVMGTIFIGFGQPIYALLGGDGPVLQAALAYSDWLFAGVVLIWLFNMLSSVMRGLGDMVRPAWAMALVTLIHLILASTLIHGAGPVPAFGMTGAALAMLGAYAIGTVFLIIHLARPGQPIAFRLHGPVPGVMLRQILGAGLLAGSQSTITIATFLMITAVVGRLGTAALAGYGIGARMEILVIPVIFGFGGAMIAMAGANIGAGQRQRAIAVAWCGCLASAAVVGAIGLGLALFPSVWSELFTDDAEVSDVTRHYLQIVGPAYAFFGLGLAAYFASQAIRSLLIPVLAAWLRFAAIGLGFTLLLMIDRFDVISAFSVIAIVMVGYGLFVALLLGSGPWRREPVA